jgi:6-phosphogluconolactonase
MRRNFPALSAVFFSLLAAPGLVAADYFMYVGTYTGQLSKGIYAWRFDPSSAKFTPLGLVAETPNPSFLAAHPNGRFLYAVNEISRFQRMLKSGSVSAFAIDPATAKLTLLNKQASLGDGPCHLTLDSQGKCLVVANYNNGSVAAFPVSPKGLLDASSAFFQHVGAGADPKRQEGPHAHCVVVTPDNRFVLAADLGLDEVLFYRFDLAHGGMVINEPRFVKVAPGAGPRHLVFHPNGKWVYLINEMQSSIVSFAYEPEGDVLSELQTVSTLPKDYTGQNDGAEIQVHPSGKFLYASNRGHNSIAVFAIDPKAGTLKPVEYVPTQGKIPRNFAIDPTGAYLIAENQQSNNMVVFRIDQASGRLTPTGQVMNVGAPVCITFVAVK